MNNIITLVRCDIQTSGDLTSINGSKYAGAMSKNKNTVGAANLVLVNQSVTGLFENRIEL